MPSALHRLEAEDALVQLRGREGTMARLGSEDGVPKLDWVEGVARLLENEAWLEEVEAEAVEIVDRGIRGGERGFGGFQLAAERRQVGGRNG